MEPLVLLAPDDLIKIGLAVVLGGLVGAEREYRDKAAGFRTMIFITLGSTLFTMLSIKVGGPDDPVRIAAQIVTGIGFLGAGTILRGERGVTGLTTAAAIWLTAALGLGVGSGQYLLAVAGTAAIMIVLWFFPRLENLIDRARLVRNYKLTLAYDDQIYSTICDLFHRSGLHILNHRRTKRSGHLECTWHVTGNPARHEELVERLIHDSCVEDLDY